MLLSLRKLGLDGLPLEQESLLLLVTAGWAHGQPDGGPALLPTQCDQEHRPFTGKRGECYPIGLRGGLGT